MGDLIDRDLLIENLMAACFDMSAHPVLQIPGVEAHTLMNELQAAPVVDAKPVRYGRWMTFGKMRTFRGKQVKLVDGLQCSLCKHRIKFDGENEFHTPYCPNCGAKMELKEV